MLVCITANHRTAPFESLERLSAVDADGLVPRLRDADDSIRGAVVLATCHRFEAYVDLADDTPWVSPVPAVDAAIETLAALSGIPHREVRDTVDVATGNGVAQHLFRVAAGLDSVAVGEDEIAGQVRRAYDRSRAGGTTTRALEQLFERATETSKAVKRATSLGESGRSVVRLALELAATRIVDWSDAGVLLVGTGRYAAVVHAALRARGVASIAVHSVSGRGRRFADQRGLPVVADDAFDAALAAADLVITCTTTPAGHAVTPERIAAGRAAIAHAGGPLPRHQLLIDLGLPRNVHPGVTGLDGVELLDIDTIRIHADIDELADLGEADDIVAAAALRHAAASRVHALAPSIVALRTWFDGIVQQELDRATARSTSPDVEPALRHLAGVLQHRLIATAHRRASGGDGDAWAAALRTVLDLDDLDDPAHLGHDREQDRTTGRAGGGAPWPSAPPTPSNRR